MDKDSLRFNLLAVANNQQLVNVVQQLAETNRTMQSDLAEMRKYISENWSMSDALDVCLLSFGFLSVSFYCFIFRKRF